jgi:hypothetical protein
MRMVVGDTTTCRHCSTPVAVMPYPSGWQPQSFLAPHDCSGACGARTTKGTACGRSTNGQEHCKLHTVGWVHPRRRPVVHRGRCLPVHPQELMRFTLSEFLSFSAAAEAIRRAGG